MTRFIYYTFLLFMPILICISVASCHTSEPLTETTKVDSAQQKKSNIQTSGKVQQNTITGPAPEGGPTGSKPKQ